MTVRLNPVLKTCLVLAFLLTALTPTMGRTALAEDPSFLPTWKLLNQQEKQHFIAGYLQGWKAAAKVTRIATQYIRENPGKAIQSLESLQSIYEMTELSPQMLVTVVDVFYSDPANKEASLSMAVSAARNELAKIPS